MAIVYDPDRHCGARSKRGSTVCCRPKGSGTQTPGYGSCYLHGGRTPNGQTGARNAIAREMLAKLGIAIEKDPQRALLETVYEAAGNVAFLRERVGEMGWDLTLTSEEMQGKHVVIREDVRAMVKLYNEERDRLAKVAKMAIDAGIAERFVRLAEEQAAAIVRVIDAVLDGLDLSDAQRQVGRQIAGRELRLVNGGKAA